MRPFLVRQAVREWMALIGEKSGTSHLYCEHCGHVPFIEGRVLASSSEQSTIVRLALQQNK